MTSLDALALSRATVDRDAERRTRPDLLAGLLGDPATAVLVLTGGRVLVEDAPDGVVTLSLLTPADVPPAVTADALALYLGRDTAGDPPRAYVALVLPDAEAAADPTGTASPDTAAPDTAAPDAGGDAQEFVRGAAAGGRRWAGLREVGALLDDTGAGLFTAAVALGNWHAVHPKCARCGTPTEVAQAGWARSCPQCGAEHYPRTDPAVIMAVVDDDGRLLLGRQAAWPPKRYSTLAGFVEPGESLEAAVRREVAEEAGVVVGDVEYRGSQPWPFPSSLMLGFRGRAVETAVHVDGVELAHARWWTREEFEADLASGELMLPPRVSIARRLIEDWYGGPVSDGADWVATPGR